MNKANTGRERPEKSMAQQLLLISEPEFLFYGESWENPAEDSKPIEERQISQIECWIG